MKWAAGGSTSSPPSGILNSEVFISSFRDTVSDITAFWVHTLSHIKDMHSIQQLNSNSKHLTSWNFKNCKVIKLGATSKTDKESAWCPSTSQLATSVSLERCHLHTVFTVLLVNSMALWFHQLQTSTNQHEQQKLFLAGHIPPLDHIKTITVLSACQLLLWQEHIYFPRVLCFQCSSEV